MKAKINDIYRIVEDSFTACETERLISELEVLFEIKERQKSPKRKTYIFSFILWDILHYLQ